MRRIARRLGGDGGKIELFRQFAGRLHGFQRADDLADEMAVGVQIGGVLPIREFCHPSAAKVVQGRRKGPSPFGLGMAALSLLIQVEQPLVLIEGEAVGHAGDVVGH